MEPIAGTIYIYLEIFEVTLTTNLETHISSLRHVLRSLEDGSYHQRRNRSSTFTLIQYELHDVPQDKIENIIRRELNNCFISLVRSFYDFVDSLLGAIMFLSEKATHLPPDVSTDEELDAYVREEIERRTAVIRSNKRLHAPTKFLSLGPYADFIEKTGIGYITLRNALEHHNGKLRADTALNMLEIEPRVDGKPITKLPIPLAKGSRIEYFLRERSKLMRAGETVVLTEADIEAVSKPFS